MYLSLAPSIFINQLKVMKKRRVSRKRQKQLTIPSWMFVVAAVIVIGLLGWYVAKNDIFSTEAGTQTGNVLSSVETSPPSAQLSEGQSTYFTAIPKGVSASGAVTYKWVTDDTGSGVGVKTSISSNSSNQVRLTAVSAPNNGGWSILKVTASFGNTDKTSIAVIRVAPAKQIASAQISFDRKPTVGGLVLTAKALDTTGAALDNAQVEYKWRIQNVTATATFHDPQGIKPWVKFIGINTGAYGGYFIVFLDATYRGTTVSTAKYVAVDPQRPALNSVVVAPAVGTYFSGRTYTFTAKALDISGKIITQGVDFSWAKNNATPPWVSVKFGTPTTGADGISSVPVTFSFNDKTHNAWSVLINATATSDGITKQSYANVSLIKR